MPLVSSIVTQCRYQYKAEEQTNNAVLFRDMSALVLCLSLKESNDVRVLLALVTLPVISTLENQDNLILGLHLGPLSVYLAAFVARS